MRVIMLIEIPDREAPHVQLKINDYLQSLVEVDLVDGYFTLCVDGQSQAKQLPDYMDAEKNLSDWTAAFESLITKSV